MIVVSTCNNSHGNCMRMQRGPIAIAVSLPFYYFQYFIFRPKTIPLKCTKLFFFFSTIGLSVIRRLGVQQSRQVEPKCHLFCRRRWNKGLH